MLQSSDHLSIKSPLAGQVYPIEQVPDPVFSQRMAGDGISVDPITDTLYAPADGTVSYIHPSLHALTLKSGPYELMMHIGIDTVGLKGDGFSQLVQPGDQVRCGDPLIRFDLDKVASKARSLMTQILVTGDAQVTPRLQGGRINVGDELFTIDGGTAGSEGNHAVSRENVQKAVVKIINPTGIHARPAASMVTELKKLNVDVTLRSGGKEANGKSIIAVMALELALDQKCEIEASGPDAEEAVARVQNILGALHDDGSEHGTNQANASATTPQTPAENLDPNTYQGAGISAGLAAGKIFCLSSEEREVPQHSNDPQAEQLRLDQGIEQARQDIQTLHQNLQRKGQTNRAAIFAAHLEILDDPEILHDTIRGIKNGQTAAFAWREAYRSREQALQKLKNELLAARANDLRDVGQRVLKLLLDEEGSGWDIPADTIIVAEDLTPSDVVGLDTELVLGFVTITGGPTSHVAILAKSLGIPAVAGVREDVLQITPGTTAILDGSEGTLKLKPSTAEINQVKAIREQAARHQQDVLSRASEAALSKDGHQFEVCANIGSLSDSQEGVRLGAEGVGLLRSEFLFLHRDREPTIDEQVSIYSDIGQALGDRPLVIRTLDVGGDKPLPYLKFPDEDNPFLGVRGIRIHRENPRIITQQVEAICQAAQDHPIAIMFPMVSFLHEIQEFKALVQGICEKKSWRVPKVGIMIEVPSAALQAEVLAPEVDFFSIGTNDLAQYTLATDRTHRQLAKTVDGLHPAVLQLIAKATAGAKKYGKHVAVCGGIASDLDAVPILMGLGIDEFSVSLPMIGEVKDEIRKFSRPACRDLGQMVLTLGTSQEVRQAARDFRS
ncbi:phosphoenolpyruvate--protein phosphotransferase [Pseudobacteriovorax antillogorgiicola]|uniref:phosphoenolpyruvate--protein phosphotransferase n=1 Tax=Pseudobacteriovorax antillogorgiicola TaxID=1513793 RepID=A0A1Y6CKA6_9BACT|nr:phosphoenolpyruvate--protein phosphotransferase [Pseudobacteriovorax antillogorgiicola]TCS47985.1 phosphocarrier protein HPr /phosphoenolpyruvate--protein phosphotransferase /PTS system IIA component (Glc family) [Pseudobacteriovorax antillogorgiicola]SMF58275.1 Phosphocarrier protein HPr /phosphoenolpyruvate--protein phosphotransferase /PTS system IIA component, Glc family [Pseudobacteriovorax antillogorgiicola]